MIKQIEIQAQDIRLNKSLHESSSQAALFNLYLSMLSGPSTRNDAINEALDDDESLYASIECTTPPKANLYAQHEDYQKHIKFVDSIHSSVNPNILIQWHQHFSPQPLHYAHEQTVLSNDVLENSPYHTQRKLKQFEQNSLDNSNAPSFTPSHSEYDMSDLYSLTKEAKAFVL